MTANPHTAPNAQPVESGSEKLLPCPFCGGDAELNDYTDKPACAWVLVHRGKDCVASPRVDSFPSRDAAIAAWNRRAPAPVEGDSCLQKMQRTPEGGEVVAYPVGDVRHGLQLIADEECDEVAAAFYATKALAFLASHGGSEDVIETPSVGGWRRIESAPRDGTEILVAGGGLLNGEVQIMAYVTGLGCWSSATLTLDDRDDDSEGYNRPTHWMPLPEPPARSDK